MVFDHGMVSHRHRYAFIRTGKVYRVSCRLALYLLWPRNLLGIGLGRAVVRRNYTDE